MVSPILNVSGKADFSEDLVYYLAKGYVWSSDTSFIMMRPILLDEGVVEPKSLEEADTWFIEWASGDMREMFRVAPKRMKHIAFYREGDKLKVYGYEHLRRKIYGQKS